jgi:hypothetical protein
MHFFTLACSAIEMSEKEKIKKYKTITQHKIIENILNRFIMPPPSIYRHVSQITKFTFSNDPRQIKFESKKIFQVLYNPFLTFKQSSKIDSVSFEKASSFVSIL